MNDSCKDIEQQKVKDNMVVFIGIIAAIITVLSFVFLSPRISAICLLVTWLMAGTAIVIIDGSGDQENCN